MENLKLEFISPTALNSNIKKEPVVWNYSGVEGHTLEINVETFIIESKQDNTQGLITEWMVNEENNSMKLKSDPDQADYSNMTPAFAISMIGQLIKHVNTYKPLQAYLDMILKIFDGASPSDRKDDDDSANNSK
ncbi:hypothetical protein ACILE2_00130 [Capnocytophaga canimorsus]|uniref:hypothetical protein n=1 Tax=Capnocytophaga canimorsus TaxID=28188 RepID=UPI0037D489D7